ncbi:pyruvate/2-oxoglutarate dehydrogenase complex, dehydrogenase component alpha subunit [Frankia torreyi]|uniref:2-oxoisovalerate dehydrogenase subunit alpha n=3 Tax=Frankia TaxID=1854 RepID=A0A0D8BHE0_9ACTN|nr:pyruvate/2-oxoglutarate dehydrogenase complex, dehydrogenase component alpha subunit [Frankia torreyi]KQM04878.1 pyruvate/2-oxoglutarate dehydrogenase complex, dehydrogenase component alpha subunit [Frankia sp. CpI1-P]
MPSVTELMQLLTPTGHRITVASRARTPEPDAPPAAPPDRPADTPPTPGRPTPGRPTPGHPKAGPDAGPPSGELTAVDIDLPAYVADLTDDELFGLYRDMVLVRRMDEEATSLQRQGELGLWASLRGQEAAQVGSGRALGPDDMAFPSYREHGVAWCRGVDPAAVLAIFRGVNLGGWDPATHGFALYSIVVGSQTLHAAGYAMGMTWDRSAGAAIVYFGDGASSEGDVNEAFGWASVFSVPLVFFCQNNQWAISEPTRRQSRTEIFHRAAGFGFPSVRVDGNDVLACLAVSRWALAIARAGRGPVLVEAVTYRMGAHTTADDPTRYRSPVELEVWRRRDPLDRMRAHLAARGLLGEERDRHLALEADTFAHELRARCTAMLDPDPTSLFDHVQVTENGLVAEQRSAFAATLDPGDGGTDDRLDREDRPGTGDRPGTEDRLGVRNGLGVKGGLVAGETHVPGETQLPGEAW